MTEADWIACNDPTALLDFLEGKASGRKLQLFAVACCYITLQSSPNPPAPESFEAVVRFANGAGTLEEVLKFWGNPSTNPQAISYPEQPLQWARAYAVDASMTSEEREIFEVADHPRNYEVLGLLCDIFGNPFHPITLDPSWLTSTVTTLARQMYDTRDFSAMPILADALQDAGCGDEEVLGQCRVEEVHVRGCFVVDLVLGKE